MVGASINFLFRQENLCYIEDYTLELIPVKKAQDEAKKWCEENYNNTAIKIVLTDELLKPLEEKKKGSNKGGKQKKQQRRKKKNKH